MPYTNYIDSALNMMLLGATVYSVPSTLYIGLGTGTSPNKDSSGFIEISGGSYSRVSVTNNTSNWTAYSTQPAIGQAQTNVNAITFATATATWGVIYSYGIFDASTNGNLLCYGRLVNPNTINTGDTATIAANTLVITLD